MMPASSPMPMNGAAPPGMPPQMPMPQMPPMPSPEQLEQDKLIAEACSWEEVSGILRSDDRRNYSIDVETDATALEDEEADKASAIEYVKAMTEMMQLWIPAIQGNPSLAPMAKELAVFVSGKFKPGRQFEEQLGDAFDQIQNTPPQPNPEAEAAKAEMAMKQQEAQMRAQETAQNMQMRGQEQTQSMQMEQAKGQQAMAQSQQEFALKVQGQQADLAFREKEIALKERELELKIRELQAKEATLMVEHQIKVRDAAVREREAAHGMMGDDADRQHAQEMAEHDAQGRDEDRELKREQVAASRDRGG